MQLPGRLSSSTLGDLLGTLHRARTSGALELLELRGPTGQGVPGRRHVIHFVRGLVVAIDTDARVPPLGEILRRDGFVDAVQIAGLLRRVAAGDARPAGEILVAEGLVSSDVVGSALRRQLRDKLDSLFGIEDAGLRFRPPRPTNARGCRGSVLLPSDFLHGRRRARERAGTAPKAAGGATRGERRSATTQQVASTDRASALAVLGLPPGASSDEVRKAFRRLAVALHPDRHGPDATARFARVTAAYHALV